MRAVIMTVVGGSAMFFGDRRDALNSLGFAAGAMLLFRPFWLFDTAFLMSVCAVLGIAFFSRTITKGVAVPLRMAFGVNKPLYYKKTLPGGKEPVWPQRIRAVKLWIVKYLSNGLGISLAAKIGITPVAAVVFTRFATYSALANFIVMPVLSLLFIVLFVGIILALILPFASAVLLAPSYAGLWVMERLAVGIADLPGADLRIFPGVAAALAIVALYFVISRYVILKNKKIVGTICAALCVVLAFSGLLPTRATGQTVMIPAGTGADTLYMSQSGAAVFVGNNTHRLNYYLHRWRVRGLDAVFVNTFTARDAENLLRLHGRNRPAAVYATAYPSPANLAPLVGTDIQFFVLDSTVFKTYGDFQITAIFNEVGDTHLGYAVNYNTVNIFQPRTEYRLLLMEPQLLDLFAVVRVYSAQHLLRLDSAPDALIISTEAYYDPLLMRTPYQLCLSNGEFSFGLDGGRVFRPRIWF